MRNQTVKRSAVVQGGIKQRLSQLRVQLANHGNTGDQKEYWPEGITKQAKSVKDPLSSGKLFDHAWCPIIPFIIVGFEQTICFFPDAESRVLIIILEGAVDFGDASLLSRVECKETGTK